MRSHCVPLNLEKQCVSDESWGKGYFYNEADAAEDSVLFPDESLAETTGYVYKGGDSAIDDYIRRGPDWDRFILDLETDEELSDSHDSDRENGSSRESGDTPTDEDSDGWAPSSNDDLDRQSVQKKKFNPSSLKDAVQAAVMQETLQKLSATDEQNSAQKRNESSAHMTKKHGEGDESRRPITNEAAKDLAQLLEWKPQSRWGSNPEHDFTSFMDREKSKAFKRCWHRSDMHPGAQERYAEQLDLLAKVARFDEEHNPYRWVRDLRFVDTHPKKKQSSSQGYV